MQDGSTISIHASFSASGSNIILNLFQSATTHSVPFSDVYYKWQFLGIFREGIVGGYALNSIVKESPSTFIISGAATFTLLVGAETDGSNPFLGVMSRFSIH